jgi:hypothetical protein
VPATGVTDGGVDKCPDDDPGDGIHAAIVSTGDGAGAIE